MYVTQTPVLDTLSCSGTIIEGNGAAFNGGGLSVYNQSQATLGDNCTFASNVAGNAGGAIFVTTWSNITFDG
jgi:predicted outer membrane repeat protein